MVDLFNYDELWNKCCLDLKKCFDEETFKTWITPIIPKDFKDNILSIEVPSKFFYEWISSHYSNVILDTLCKITGFNVRIEYSIKNNDVSRFSLSY